MIPIPILIRRSLALRARPGRLGRRAGRAAVASALLLSGPVVATQAGAAGLVTPRSPAACGSTFSIVSTPNPGSVSNELDDVVQVATDDVWAVGYSNGGGSSETLAIHDDGAGWKVVPSPSPGSQGAILSSVDAAASNDVWSVGSSFGSTAQKTLIEHWGGSAWAVVTSPNAGKPRNGALSGVDVRTPTDGWAVGSYVDKHGITLTLAERWNGSSWKIVPTPNPTPPGAPPNGALASVHGLSATNAWAVGSFLDDAALPQPLVEHWNGTAWSVVATPDLQADEAGLFDVTATSSTAVWAVGHDDLSTLVERWNGSSWSVVPSPTPGTHANAYLGGITVIKVGDLWAVGAFVTDAGALGTLVEHWNGSSWSVSASASLPNGDNRLASVDGNATEVWSVGSFVSNSGPPERTLGLHRCPG